MKSAAHFQWSCDVA